MEKVKVINNLDPAKDGFEKKPDKYEVDRINCGMVINTHGEYRLLDEMDVAKIWYSLEGKKKSFPVGEYLGIVNEEKILKKKDLGYVVGSILVLNIDPNHGPKAFCPGDEAKVLGEIENHIVVLKVDGEEFLSYEMYL